MMEDLIKKRLATLEKRLNRASGSVKEAIQEQIDLINDQIGSGNKKSADKPKNNKKEEHIKSDKKKGTDKSHKKENKITKDDSNDLI